MKYLTTTLALGLLSAGFVAMSQGYSHPGSLAKPHETANVFGAECYVPSAITMLICHGGAPSTCLGCGCQLRQYADPIPSGGANSVQMLCDADPTCTFDEVDVGRFCDGTSRDVGGEGGESGG